MRGNKKDCSRGARLKLTGEKSWARAHTRCLGIYDDDDDIDDDDKTMCGALLYMLLLA